MWPKYPCYLKEIIKLLTDQSNLTNLAALRGVAKVNGQRCVVVLI